jgi:hypothetical protein
MKVEANKTYVGVVEDNEDPKKLGRVRVRVLDVFEILTYTMGNALEDLNGNKFMYLRGVVV